MSTLTHQPDVKPLDQTAMSHITSTSTMTPIAAASAVVSKAAAKKRRCDMTAGTSSSQWSYQASARCACLTAYRSDSDAQTAAQSQQLFARERFQPGYLDTLRTTTEPAAAEVASDAGRIDVRYCDFVPLPGLHVRLERNLGVDTIDAMTV